MKNIDLSIIIPCARGKKAVFNILSMFMHYDTYDNMEIIIADDSKDFNSSDDFYQYIDSFTDVLNIVYVKVTNNIHSPGNTRLFGLSVANGKWIAFIDDDDSYMSNTLQMFMTAINNVVDNVAIIRMPFQTRELKTKTIIRKIETGTTWLHGNLYRKSLLDDYNIRFSDTIILNEDIYFNVMCTIACIEHDLEILDMPNTPVYIHYNNKVDGISLADDALITGLSDYVNASIPPWLSFYNRTSLKKHKQICIDNVLSSIIVAYFQLQLIVYNNLSTYLNFTGIITIRAEINHTLEVFKFTKHKLIAELYKNPDVYTIIRDSTLTLLPFIIIDSLCDFIMNI